MGKKTRFHGWIFSGLLSLAASGSALACAFHGYTPNPTIVDALLGTEQVVIAGLSPTNSKRYVPLGTLLGASVSDIPIAVDPSLGRQLAIDPAARVLLARDGAYGPWVEIAVLDTEFRGLVEEILLRQSPWLYGGDQERLAFFAKRLNHPNASIRRLALRELDRVPYGELKRVRLPAVQGLKRDLNAGDTDLKPIRILLAGLSRDSSFGPVLVDELDKLIRNEAPHLGAYATALIELEGKAGVQKLRRRYFDSETLPDEAREKLLQALAVQYRAAPRSTRRLIAREVAELSRKSPDFSEAVGRYFVTLRGRRLANP